MPIIAATFLAVITAWITSVRLLNRQLQVCQPPPVLIHSICRVCYDTPVQQGSGLCMQLMMLLVVQTTRLKCRWRFQKHLRFHNHLVVELLPVILTMFQAQRNNTNG